MFADADLEDALDGVLYGIYFNQGECCVSGTRLLIEDSVADEFVEKLVEKSRSLRVGDPMGESTDIGALIHREHVDKVLGYIRRGEEEGAHLLTVSRDLQAGRIWVNTTIDGGPQLPAGGFKASGFGREMGYAGLEEFTEIKSILYRLGKREPYFGSDWSR